MNEEPRCCGSGTCIIDSDGRCWCGEQWDGQKMCYAPLFQAESPERAVAKQSPCPPTGSKSCPAA
jgi:hypothetical protein